MKKILLLILSFFLILICSSCSKKEQSIDEIISSFYATGHQVKSNMIIKDKNSHILLEAFIDSSGNGKGLISIGDVVCDVIFVYNNLYISLLDKYYCISDLGYHITLNRLKDNFSKIDDITDAGFRLNETQIIGFNGTSNNITFNNQYALMNEFFNVQTIPKEIELNMYDFIELALNINEKKSDKSEIIGEMIEETSSEETKESTELKKTLEPSFYTLSDLGITINNNIFSINDFINPSDYFFNLTPEGISYKYEWDKDTKIKIQYTSYINTTGKVTFVSIDNLINKIEVSGDFKFLNFYFGQSYDDVEKLLGNRLTKKQQESFKPIRNDLILNKINSKATNFTIGNLNITLHFSDRKLKAITLDKNKEYEMYEK